jgi:hypothetical protein
MAGAGAGDLVDLHIIFLEWLAYRDYNLIKDTLYYFSAKSMLFSCTSLRKDKLQIRLTELFKHRTIIS